VHHCARQGRCCLRSPQLCCPPRGPAIVQAAQTLTQHGFMDTCGHSRHQKPQPRVPLTGAGTGVACREKIVTKCHPGQDAGVTGCHDVRALCQYLNRSTQCRPGLVPTRYPASSGWTQRRTPDYSKNIQRPDARGGGHLTLHPLSGYSKGDRGDPANQDPWAVSTRTGPSECRQNQRPSQDCTTLSPSLSQTLHNLSPQLTPSVPSRPSQPSPPQSHTLTLPLSLTPSHCPHLSFAVLGFELRASP
jgi:hypothetical protein